MAALATIVVRGHLRRKENSQVYLVSGAAASGDLDRYGMLSEAAERGVARSEETKVSSAAMGAAAKSEPAHEAEDPGVPETCKAATLLEVNKLDEAVVLNEVVLQETVTPSEKKE